MNLLRKQLEIQHSDQLPTPNQWIHQEKTSKKQAVLFPGKHYSCDFPLFYFPIKTLLNQGFDYLRLDYNYQNTAWKTTQEFLQLDAQKSLEALEQEKAPKPLLLIGKSLGTYALASLIDQSQILPEAKIICLTPLLNNDWVYQQMLSCKNTSLLVIGDKDPHYRSSKLDTLAQTDNWTIKIISNADHSLEIPSDATASFEAFSESILAINSFILGE